MSTRLAGITGIRSWLEGWELGLLTVATAALGTLLVVPRPAEPTDVPLPVVDQAALRRSLDADREIARRFAAELGSKDADRAAESFELRTLGDRIRAFGVADHRHDVDALPDARSQLVEAAAKASRLGPARLVALRDYELTLFLDALASWERGGPLSEDLIALGADFLGTAASQGWIEGRHVLLDEGARSALFKRRWSEITGLRQPELALGMEEARAFYAFLLSHPPATLLARGGDDAAAACAAIDHWRLKKIDELALFDATYPRGIARAVILWRTGSPSLAIADLRAWLEEHPDGPWTLRARNWLATALRRSASTDDPQ